MFGLKYIAKSWNLFPCPNCGGDGNGRNELCAECRKQIEFIQGKRCPSCGGVLDGFLASCSRCMSEELRPWVSAIAAYHYTGLGRDLIRKYKFSRQMELARFFAEILTPLVKQSHEQCDMLVPIPLHFTRYWWRGFNQAELIAKLCAKDLDIPCVNALKRVKRTPHQSGLNRKTRLKNLENAFTVPNPTLIANKNIWLVDDVMTTGTTLRKAAETLQKAGAGQIHVLVIARA